MEDISVENKISAEELIKSGKNIGDEMDPDVNVDDTKDEKLNFEVIKPKTEVEKKDTVEVVAENKAVEEKSEKKDFRWWHYLLMAVFVAVVSGLVAWFYIF